jgi:hypothetical protein
MRARPAYISSLGTTAILVAAALLMLAVVSAIVAFRGWPGSATGDGGVQSVPLAPRGGAERAALVRRTATPVRGVERSKARRAAPATKHATASTAGLVKSKAKGRRTVPGIVMEPAVAAPMQAQQSRPGRESAPPAAQAVPTTSQPTPERQLPGQPGGPVGDGGGVTIPLPVPVPVPLPGDPPPSAVQVTTMVGDLLTGSAPPPPLLDTLGIR